MRTALFPLLLLIFTVAFIGCSEDEATKPQTDPDGYISASISKGGIMYDTFWSTESGFNQTDPNLALFKSKADFFRCKQCHGWEQLGTAASYNSRGPRTSRPNVSSLNIYQIAKSKSAQELFDAMKKTSGRRDVSFDLATYDPATNSTVGDQMPDYGKILTDAQIWDIVKFLREGAFDVSQLYDATYTGTYPTGKAVYSNIGKDGDAAKGIAYYNTKCAMCHGVKGDNFLMENMAVGKFTRNKPYEVQQKIKYGQLGSTMAGDFGISLSTMKDLYKAMADTLAYP